MKKKNEVTFVKFNTRTNRRHGLAIYQTSRNDGDDEESQRYQPGAQGCSCGHFFSQTHAHTQREREKKKNMKKKKLP